MEEPQRVREINMGKLQLPPEKMKERIKRLLDCCYKLFRAKAELNASQQTIKFHEVICTLSFSLSLMPLSDKYEGTTDKEVRDKMVNLDGHVLWFLAKAAEIDTTPEEKQLVLTFTEDYRESFPE
jgi:hypothetical protein